MTTHYEVEDVPPNDVDTQVQLFEQSNQTVKDGATVAEQIRTDAEQVLGSIFHDADKAGNTSLANRVNDVWEQVQTLTTVAVRQGAALNGANGAITALKDQRDKVLKELNGIKEAIRDFDTGHEALSEFVEGLEQSWDENMTDWYYDSYFDDAYDTVREEMFFIFRNRVGMSNAEADVMFALLKGDELMTDEQVDLLKKFAVTLRQKDESKADEQS